MGDDIETGRSTGSNYSHLSNNRGGGGVEGGEGWGERAHQERFVESESLINELFN